MGRSWPLLTFCIAMPVPVRYLAINIKVFVEQVSENSGELVFHIRGKAVELKPKTFITMQHLHSMGHMEQSQNDANTTPNH
jgi:hypothetical protein